LIHQELSNPDPGMASGMKLLREKICALLEKEPGLKKFEVADHLRMELSDIGPAIDFLLKTQRIERRGKYQNTMFYLLGQAPEEGREEGSFEPAERDEPRPTT